MDIKCDFFMKMTHGRLRLSWLVVIGYIFVVLSKITAGTSHVGPINGSFTPNFGTVCTGHNITYTCGLHNESDGMSSADLVISVDGSIVDPDQIHIQNDTTVVYTLYNVSYPGRRYINLSCCWRECNDTSYIVGGTPQLLEVYKAPQHVKDLRCVAYDWTVWMICTWNLGLDYIQNPDVNMQMKIVNYSRWVSCSNLGENNNQCTWYPNTTVDFTQSPTYDMEVRVNVRSGCGLSVQTSYSLTDVKFIQPAAPHISVNVINATCVHMAVGTNTRKEMKKNYRVAYSYQLRVKPEKMSIQMPVLLIKDTDKTHAEDKFRTVCGLLPFSLYTFSVEVSPQGESKWLWSEPTNQTVATPQTLPGASPKMLPGMFSWKRTDCQANNAVRNVYVYTEPIEDRFWNGRRKAVVFSYRSMPGGDDGERSEPFDVTYASLQLQCDRDYKVSVQVRNQIGLSPNNSNIYIPTAQRALDMPEFIVDTTSTEHEVKFEWLERLPDVVKEYTVYWCRHINAGKDNCESTSAIQWRTAQTNQTDVLLDVGKQDNVLIGVSIETDGNSSGIYWESCIFAYNGVPGKPTVKVEVGSDDNSLYVTWEKLRCRPGEPYVNKYWVSYCKLNSDQHCEDNFTIEVPSDQASIMLRDLDAEHKYSVYVKGIARNGYQGYSSDEVIKQPIDDSLKNVEIAGIVVGCAFGVAFAVAGFVFVLRRCGKRAKKTFTPTKIDNMIIDRPAIPTEDEEEQGQGPWENNNQSGDSKPDEGPDGDGDLRVKLEQKPVKEFNRQRSNDSGLPQSPTEDGYVKAYVHPNGIRSTRIPYSLDYQQNFAPGPQVIIDMNVGHATFQPVQDQTLQKDVFPNSDVGDETARKDVWTRPSVVDLSRDEDGVGDESVRKEVWTRPGVGDLSRDEDDVRDETARKEVWTRPGVVDLSRDEDGVGDETVRKDVWTRPGVVDLSRDEDDVGDETARKEVWTRPGVGDLSRDGDDLTHVFEDEESLSGSGHCLINISRPEIKTTSNNGNNMHVNGKPYVLYKTGKIDANDSLGNENNDEENSVLLDSGYVLASCSAEGDLELSKSEKDGGNKDNKLMSGGSMTAVSDLTAADQNTEMGPLEIAGYHPHNNPADSNQQDNNNSVDAQFSDNTPVKCGYIPLDSSHKPVHQPCTTTNTCSNAGIIPDDFVSQTQTATDNPYLPHNTPLGLQQQNTDSKTGVSDYLPHNTSLGLQQQNTEADSNTQTDNNIGVGDYLQHNTSLGLQQQNTEADSNTQTETNIGVGDYLPHNTSLGLQVQNTEASSNTQTDTNTGMGDYLPHNTSLGLPPQNTEADSNTQTDNNTGVGDYLPHNTSLGLQSQNTEASRNTQTETNIGVGDYLPRNTPLGLPPQNTEADSNTQTDNNTGVSDYLPHNTSLGLQQQNTEADSNTQTDNNTGVGDYLPHNTPLGLQSQNTEASRNTQTDTNTGVGDYLPHNTPLGLPLHNTEATVGFGYQPISNSQGSESNLYVTEIPGEGSVQGQTPVTSGMIPPEMQAGVNSPGYVSSDQGPGYIDESVIKHLSGVDSLQSPDSDCSSLTSNADAQSISINLPEIPVPQCLAD